MDHPPFSSHFVLRRAAEIVALCETFATVCFTEYDEENDVMLSDLKKLPVKSPDIQTNEFPFKPHGGHNSWECSHIELVGPQEKSPQ